MPHSSQVLDTALGTYTSAEEELYGDTTELLRDKLDSVTNVLATRRSPYGS